MGKIRLDVLLTQQGLAESREKAKAYIMSGIVFVDGQRVDKAGMSVSEDCKLEVRGNNLAYVSRGGLKIERALDFFEVSPQGRVCIDCGASTGGFTDCMLKRGAVKVYSVDVGYGQLAWSLRNDPRVVVMERTNARYLTPDMFKPSPSFASIDVSFISLSLILPAVKSVLTDDGEVCCLIKPQFEAGRENVGKNGVVREAAIHTQVLDNFIEYAKKTGFTVENITYSPVKGPEGNIEFLGHLIFGKSVREIDTAAVVAEAHEKL